jgi:predicted aminopeptidase
MRRLIPEYVQIAMLKGLTPLRVILIIGSGITVSGCSSFGYYMDLMAGHSELIEHRKPIVDLIASKETRPKLRELLKRSVDIRNFATKILYLPENDSYRLYADIKRPYAVWNVVAAEEFSLQPKQWCFLIVGCLSYRGYFLKEDATKYANELGTEGYDVYLSGARAYSTLGWFDDPLLNTMMYKSEAYRAGIIFHELAHQVVYVDDDSAFNEAFATTVEEEGIQRWFAANQKKEEYEKYLEAKQRDHQINELLRSTRMKLKDLYASNQSTNVMRAAKKMIFAEMRKDYEKLKKSWKGYNGFDDWMYKNLNNAHLLLVATYHDLVPAFRYLLHEQKNDMKKFYQAVKALGTLDKDKRHKHLTQMNVRISKK